MSDWEEPLDTDEPAPDPVPAWLIRQRKQTNAQQGVGGSRITTDERYVGWIAAWLGSNDPHHACNGATREMRESFPELRRVRGHIVLCDGTRTQHWWCETENGEIADPTAVQFGTDMIEGYDPVDESRDHTFPTGKCPNDGWTCYRGESFCSSECAQEYEEYMNRGR